jgi:hypothetical protein
MQIQVLAICGAHGDIETKVSNSSLWKTIVQLSPKFNYYCFWVVGNRRSVEAWSNVWIEVGLRYDIKDVKVCDSW